MEELGWFDSHAHLQDAAFDEDRKAMLEKIQAAGITRVILPASDLEDARRACALALEHPFLSASIGFHPHEAKHFGPESLAAMQALYDETERLGQAQGREKTVVAVGEIGLDYHYDHSPRERQREVFWAQLEWAATLNLPVIIHERSAFQDSYEILARAAEQGLLQDPPGVCHCFSGSRESAQLLLKLGFYLGFDGPITFKNAKKPREVLASIPADRLLMETDSPYLTPHPFRGKRNDPSRLPLIGEAAAVLQGLSINELKQQSHENTLRCFHLSS